MICFEGAKDLDNSLYPKNLSNIVQKVVLVKTSSGWGSGLLFNQSQALIITCAHVINGVQMVEVAFDCPMRGRTWFKADVVFQNAMTSVFDLAVLVVRNRRRLFEILPEEDIDIVSAEPGNNPPPHLKVCIQIMFFRISCFILGMPCFAVGHALFESYQHVPTTITSGVVSSVFKVNRAANDLAKVNKGTPVLIQSTCVVNNGASGGVLINANGQILGVIVCNAKQVYRLPLSSLPPILFFSLCFLLFSRSHFDVVMIT